MRKGSYIDSDLIDILEKGGELIYQNYKRENINKSQYIKVDMTFTCKSTNKIYKINKISPALHNCINGKDKDYVRVELYYMFLKNKDDKEELKHLTYIKDKEGNRNTFIIAKQKNGCWSVRFDFE